MKRILIAPLGLSFLNSTAVFAQNTSSTQDTMSTGTVKTKTTHKKNKKGETTSSTTSTSTSQVIVPIRHGFPAVCMSLEEGRPNCGDI